MHAAACQAGQQCIQAPEHRRASLQRSLPSTSPAAAPHHHRRPWGSPGASTTRSAAAGCLRPRPTRCPGGATATWPTLLWAGEGAQHRGGGAGAGSRASRRLLATPLRPAAACLCSLTALAASLPACSQVPRCGGPPETEFSLGECPPASPLSPQPGLSALQRRAASFVLTPRSILLQATTMAFLAWGLLEFPRAYAAAGAAPAALDNLRWVRGVLGARAALLVGSSRDQAGQGACHVT